MGIKEKNEILQAIKDRDYQYFVERFQNDRQFRIAVLSALGATALIAVIAWRTPWARRKLLVLWWEIQANAEQIAAQIFRQIDEHRKAPKRLKELPKGWLCRVIKKRSVDDDVHQSLLALYKLEVLLEKPAPSYNLFLYSEYNSLLDVEKAGQEGKKHLQILLNAGLLHSLGAKQ